MVEWTHLGIIPPLAFAGSFELRSLAVGHNLDLIDQLFEIGQLFIGKERFWISFR